MSARLSRRGFFRAAQGGVGVMTYAAQAQNTSVPKPKVPRISGTTYTPAEYPIIAKRYSEVRLKDQFWSPKVKTNAEVTIPFEVQKLMDSASAREFGGGVLEAAILSLQTHPDPKLQA